MTLGIGIVALGCAVQPTSLDDDIASSRWAATFDCAGSYPGPGYSGSCRSGMADLTCSDSCSDFTALEDCLRIECEASCGTDAGSGDGGTDAGAGGGTCNQVYTGSCVYCDGMASGHPIGSWTCGAPPSTRPDCTPTPPMMDAGGGGMDAGSPGTDSGSPGTDSGSPGTDSGSPGTDSGSPGTDSGSPGMDSGTPGTDSGTPGTDSGTPPGTDAGTGGDGGDAGDAGDAGDPCDGVDCSDGDPCTDDDCSDGACSNPPRADFCCTSDADCEGMGGEPMCTMSICSVATGYCEHEPTDECVCVVPDTPPVTLNPPALELPDTTVSCPGFLGGGSVGLALEVEASATVDPPHCGNECEGSAMASIEATGSLDACNKFDVELSISGSYEGTTRGCLTCDTLAGACLEECDGRCTTHELEGEISGSISRFFGWRVASRIGGSRIRVNLACGAEVSLSPSGSLSVSGTNETDYTCGECEECISVNADASLAIDAGLRCDFQIQAFGRSISRGCERCAGIEATVAGGGHVQRGECEDESCGYGSVAGRVYAQTPCMTLGYGWFRVGGRCTASISGCAEATTCGSCTCGDDPPSASGVCTDFNAPEITCEAGC